MKESFELEVRLDYHMPDGSVQIGSYGHWKNYKTYQGVMDAHNYYKRHPIGMSTASQHGVVLHKTSWHFRPRHRYISE